MVNVVVFAYGDDEVPNASPSMTIFANDSMQVTDSYEGSAPVKATFNSNASDYGGYTPIYEWRFFNSENSETPFLVRYDANTEYTFNESGSFTIQLCISFVNGEDTVEYLQESPFTISISTSKLEIPNAFSPNGDGQNDVFKVKEGHQSIVSFHGYIFNRWGKKIYDWKNRLKDRHMLSLVVTLIVIIVALGLYIYKKQTEYRQASENQYNMAFYELVDYVQNNGVEN